LTVLEQALVDSRVVSPHWDCAVLFFLSILLVMRIEFMASARTLHSRFRHAPAAVLLSLLVIALLLANPAYGQGRFRLKRTKSEAFPLTIQLYGGYNGMSHPSEQLQKDFETVNNAWGGVMLGVKTRVMIDTILRPFWIGLDLYYHSTAKRSLAAKHLDYSVYYASDSSQVNAYEYLNTYGAHLYFAIDVYKRVFIEFGGGVQYLVSNADITSDVVGLYSPVWIPTVMGGISAPLLRYDHGSIDAYLRITKGFGTYGSVHFQSLLEFTFNF
jgi:hypothetical protein